MNKLFAGISTAIVLVALVWGFTIAGSPMYGRAVRFDERRVQDIQTIQNEIRNIAYQGRQWDMGSDPTQPLPKSLNAAATQSMDVELSTADPETGMQYEYAVTGKNTYDVCATFNQERDLPYDISWNHPVGHHCYHFDVTRQDGAVKPVSAPVETVPVK